MVLVCYENLKGSTKSLVSEASLALEAQAKGRAHPAAPAIRPEARACDAGETIFLVTDLQIATNALMTRKGSATNREY